MNSLIVAAVKETAPGERRVAVVPEAVGRLTAAGFAVQVETDAGAAAWFPDEMYAEAGATVVTRDELYEQADIVVTVGKPSAATVARLRSGQVLVGLLSPLTDPELARDLADKGVTAVSLDGLPRTLSAAQSMDVLSSQANVTGYKAVLVAANTYGRYFPLLMTAAGTAKPAQVLILGAGVAGLQAIGTARRLGAIVSVYDVRPQAKGDAESLGAKFITLKSVGDAAGEGGYARELTPEEQQAQQDELNGYIAAADIVITTAQVPGRRPPLLVTADAVKKMQPGSVIVDVAASPLGGNVEVSRPGETVVTDEKITVIGAGTLPAEMPAASSAMYARNITALLKHLVRDGALTIDLDDEIQAGVIVAHGGKVVHAATAALLDPADTTAAPSGGAK